MPRVFIGGKFIGGGKAFMLLTNAFGPWAHVWDHRYCARLGVLVLALSATGRATQVSASVRLQSPSSISLLVVLHKASA